MHHSEKEIVSTSSSINVVNHNQMTETILSLGSNYGDRKSHVKAAAEWLQNLFSDYKASSIYTTGDCHGGKRHYMNAVVVGKTDLTFSQLDEYCKRYELTNGRTNEARLRGDVPIDIDIVMYAGEITRPKDFWQSFFQIGLKQITSIDQ